MSELIYTSKLRMIIVIFCFASYAFAQNKYIAHIIQPDLQQTPSICLVSVTPENKNLVVWEKPFGSQTDSFRIYRESTMQTDQWILIGSKEYAAPSVFIDSTIDPSMQSFSYKISSVDKCRYETALSSEHKTINLSIVKGMNNTWSLIWNQYEGFEVISYNIYRGSTPDNMQLIRSTTAGSCIYSDLSAPAGNLYYLIEVVSPNICNPSIFKSTSTYNSSKSNIATNKTTIGINTSEKEPCIQIYPNPFNNRTTITFPNNDKQEYTISLINVTGEIVFSTKTNAEKIEIEKGNLKKGIYIVEVKGPRFKTGKLVVNE